MLGERTTYGEAIRHERVLYVLLRQGLPKDDDRVDFERRGIDRLLRTIVERGDYQELRGFVGPTVSVLHVFTRYPSTQKLRASIYPGLDPEEVTNVARALDTPLIMYMDSALPVSEARELLRLLLRLNAQQSPFLMEQQSGKKHDS